VCSNISQVCLYLDKNCAVWPGPFGLDVQASLASLQPVHKGRFRSNCGQNRRCRPPGGQDGLWSGLLAAKTAFGLASWRPRRLYPQRPRRPLDGPPGAQDGLWTVGGAKQAFDACAFCRSCCAYMTTLLNT